MLVEIPLAQTRGKMRLSGSALSSPPILQERDGCSVALPRRIAALCGLPVGARASSSADEPPFDFSQAVSLPNQQEAELWNVIFGDMSLVGPRPHALRAKAADKLYGEAVAEYAARHRVKPGITGWAQVSGWRGETDTIEKIRRRVEHDLYYIENWSLALDLRILAQTFVIAITASNAY
jgi:hypothetical protein